MHRPVSAPLALVVALAVTGCLHPVEEVGDSDSALWLRMEGPMAGETLVAHAFVLSSRPDFCERFVERWGLWDAASRTFLERRDALPDEPSAERCQARADWWEARLDAEEGLYFQDARHTVVFLDSLEGPDDSWYPTAAGTPRLGELGAGEDRTDDDPALRISTSRARASTATLPLELLDCDLPEVQVLAKQTFSYPGPPREHWRADRGVGRFTASDDGTSWQFEVTDGQLEFVQEVSYRAPTEDVGWDPRVLDEEPRDPVPLSFDREFERCDAQFDFTVSTWLNIYSWAIGSMW